MSMTGTQLSTLFTTFMHNDIILSTQDKLDYLTLGQERIIRDAPTILAKKEASLAVVASTQEYSLASDFYMMHAIWLQSNGWKLYPIAAAEFIEDVERIPTIPSGPPTGYHILGYDTTIATPAMRLRFNYNPDASYTVEYWYHYMPAAVTASVVPAVSAMGFSELLLWASIMIALQPKDPQGSATATQHYLANLEKFMAYRPMAPDYTPTLRPGGIGQRARFPLGPHYPDV